MENEFSVELRANYALAKLTNKKNLKGAPYSDFIVCQCVISINSIDLLHLAKYFNQFKLA